MREVARMSWLPRAGVGSSLCGRRQSGVPFILGVPRRAFTYSRMKNGFRESTTDS